MTICIEQYENDDYYVSLEVTRKYNREIYVVQVCPRIDECRCGYPEREITYSIQDEKKARATYRRYIREFCKQ